MSHPLKLAAYRTARLLGCFALARWCSRKHLRILAYHGFAKTDEARFRSKLFINPDTFARRLDLLRRRNYRVLPLGTGLTDLATGCLRPNSVVITIDDGYASTLHLAAPLLHARSMPATVYLTSYHAKTQTPVFDLMVGYLLWKTQQTGFDMAWPTGSALRHFPLETNSQRQATCDTLTAWGHGADTEAERVVLWQELARATGTEADAERVSDAFRLLSPDEAKRIQSLGVEIALHTHRHRFPAERPDVCRQELQDNRDYLERELGVQSAHFCYPSGVYSPEQFSVLAEAGIISATTCDTGLVRRGDSYYDLARFLDGESVADIEFEAEVSGFAELLRRLLRVNRRMTPMATQS